jgi:hypothetical protein
MLLWRRFAALNGFLPLRKTLDCNLYNLFNSGFYISAFFKRSRCTGLFEPELLTMHCLKLCGIMNGDEVLLGDPGADTYTWGGCKTDMT